MRRCYTIKHTLVLIGFVVICDVSPLVSSRAFADTVTPPYSVPHTRIPTHPTDKSAENKRPVVKKLPVPAYRKGSVRPTKNLLRAPLVTPQQHR